MITSTMASVHLCNSFGGLLLLWFYQVAGYGVVQIRFIGSANRRPDHFPSFPRGTSPLCAYDVSRQEEEKINPLKSCAMVYPNS